MPGGVVAVAVVVVATREEIEYDVSLMTKLSVIESNAEADFLALHWREVPMCVFQTSASLITATSCLAL